MIRKRREIRELFDTGKPEEMLEYIQIYATSVESPDEKDKSSQKAWELYQYLERNREGLLPYDKRGIKIAAPPEGILYKRMCAGKSELYGDHAEDEEPKDALVGKRSQ